MIQWQMADHREKKAISISVARPWSRDAEGHVMLNRITGRLFEAEPVPVAVGRFQVSDAIGAGGMGVIYRARDPKLEREVALKLVRTEMLDDQVESSRLLREAQALAQLSHPNVVQVHEVGEAEGQTFIAMELVEGIPLDKWLQQEPLLGWKDCLRAYLQAGAGLAAAHAEGLVHRDFKPGNAIIDRKGQVRVLDFGLARQATVTAIEEHENTSTETDAKDTKLDTLVTQTGAVLGTPAYMPLEQFHGRPADARSDQFSFCVALYEALYRERPFDGRTVAALEASVEAGRVRPAPKTTAVPVKLWQVLERGLATKPQDRWPSMEALLAELQRFVIPRTTRWWAVSMAVVGLGLLAGGFGFTRLASLLEEERKERCSGGPAAIGAIWNDARRQEVEAAILGTELVYASGTWERVEARLDAYAEAWVAKHTDACQATVVGREQTEETMDLRMRCLHDRLTTLDARVKVLTQADDQVVENGVALVTGIPELAQCDDVARLVDLQQRVPPPEDLEVAREVEELREHLEDIGSEEAAGRYRVALNRLAPVLERAETLDYMPLLAEVKHLHGRILDGNGQYVEAEKNLVQAHALAVEHGHDEVALDAARSLAYVVGYRQARHAEGLVWGKSTLPLARRTREFMKLATHIGSIGAVLHAQGKYEESERRFRRAYQILTGSLDEEHLSIVASIGNVGEVLQAQGKYKKAAEFHLRALEMCERLLGGRHPDVATNSNNLGAALYLQGRYGEAEQYHRRALKVREDALGADHPHVAVSLTNIGLLLENRGRYDEAEHHHRRALEIWKHALGLDHPNVGYSLTNLGVMFYSQARYEQAEYYHRQALELWTKSLGVDHSNVANSLNNLGGALAEQGKYEEAGSLYRRGLQIYERSLGPNHATTAYPLVGLAEVSLAQDQHDVARKYAERAVSVREAVDLEPYLLAEARFALARSLWPDHTQRPRARELAKQAEITYAELGHRHDGELAAVQDWLDGRPAP